VRIETSPEDIHGMHAAKGILTARGGMTSHAAVVARGMGRPCVSARAALRSTMKPAKHCAVGAQLKKGDIITIDGATGEVLVGAVPMVEPELSGDFGTLMGWADKVRRMKVRANAETPLDAAPRASSAPKASAFAAPSTCSSTPSASSPCAR
jgi:pyruvate,orthophosphate dikinase